MVILLQLLYQQATPAYRLVPSTIISLVVIDVMLHGILPQHRSIDHQGEHMKTWISEHTPSGSFVALLEPCGLKDMNNFCYELLYSRPTLLTVSEKDWQRQQRLEVHREHSV